MKADKPHFIATSLLMVSFVLDSFVKMYWIPASESAMISWIGWICGMAGIVLFISTIITMKKNHR
ncbi:MAG: hypothetical protein WA021_05975 [Minisyncoccia bacterium]